ncbi:MAG: hypothetical protein OEZ48_00310 [Candidatus Bathyarchaeota archaeon]|nr:hypothetical protein [Candidatus Bathyarchaeota archaeon]MDH5686298.1 hypothetical protein [Candidatus Bathyarchaeota archaeon]
MTHYSAIATTTTLAKVRGFTIHLLFHIRNRELRVSDLVDLTGKYPRYISRYLYNMRNYGLVQRNGPYWKLSEEGLSFLSYLESIDIDIDKIRKKEERRKKERRKKEESWTPKKVKQLSFSLWLQDSGRTFQDAEKVVVEVLVDHYNETGSKFLYCDHYDFDVAEKFKIRPDQVTRVLRKLREDRIIYNFRDTRAPGGPAWKLGLYKAFIETLEASQKS